MISQSTAVSFNDFHFERGQGSRFVADDDRTEVNNILKQPLLECAC
jgi:hypothetical protein